LGRYEGTFHFDIAALRDETVRGYEVSKGQYVKVEDAEQLLSRARQGANKPYRLLADTMAKDRPRGNHWPTCHQMEGGLVRKRQKAIIQ